MSEISNDEYVNATTPEALAALMARGNEDAAKGGQAATSQPSQAAVDAATQQGGEQATTDGATPGANDEQVHGIATKSGKGVLPYRVLTEARHEASEAKAANRSMAAQLADTQRQLDEAQQALNERQRAAGVSQTDSPEEITDEEIANVEADFPAMAKAMRVARRAALTVTQAPTPNAPANSPQEDADERAAAVEQAMAGNSLLLRARQQGGVLWGRACEIDAQFRQDPHFSTVSPAARFAQVNAALAKELGVSLAPTQSAATPHIEPIQLNTTSDLIGGTAPGSNEAFGPNASGMAMARRMQDMSPQQLDALIRRTG